MLVNSQILATFTSTGNKFSMSKEKVVSDCNETCDNDIMHRDHTHDYSYNRPKLVPSVLEICDAATKTFRVSSVALKRSPLMLCHINHATVPVILDTGAENNVIGDITCKKLGLKIQQTCSQAQQVDKSPLKSVGRVVFNLENGQDSWLYDGLVCSGIGDIIIAGNPLLVQGINPVTYKNAIEIVSKQGGIRSIPWRPDVPLNLTKSNVFLLKVDRQVTVYP